MVMQRKRMVARPTQRALRLAGSPKGQALAMRIGRGGMVARTIGRYTSRGFNPFRGTIVGTIARRLLGRKAQLRAIPKRRR